MKSLSILFFYNLDTYQSTKDVVEIVRAHLTEEIAILFDEKDYKFVSFSTHFEQVTIQLNKKN